MDQSALFPALQFQGEFAGLRCRQGSAVVSDGRPAALACSMPHNSTGGGYFVQRGGNGVIMLQAEGQSESEGSPVSVKRSGVREFSPQSRLNLLCQVNAIPWAQFPFLGLITLTSPGWDERHLIPNDGRVWSRWVVAMRKRLERWLGRSLGYLVKMEFQSRDSRTKAERQGGEVNRWDEVEPWQKCAVHSHLWVVLYPEVDHWTGLRWDGPDPFQEFVESSWSEIVGTSGVTRSGTSVHYLNPNGDGRHPCRYCKGYLVKGGAKEYQNRVPDGFVNPGRFWSYGGELKPEWGPRVRLSRKYFHRLRRWAFKWQNARRREAWKRAKSEGKSFPLRLLKSRGGEAGAFIVGNVVPFLNQFDGRLAEALRG